MSNTQSQINFIKQVCGGGSISDILRSSRNFQSCRNITLSVDSDGNLWNLDKITPAVKSSLEWFTDAKLGWWKLEKDCIDQQLAETINVVAALLGYKSGEEHE